MNHSDITNKTAVDPVCRMQVRADDSRLTATYRQCTYYFCAPCCKTAFEADPEKYLNPKPGKPKGWWARYLERLQRATGGKSMSCH